MTTLAKYKTGLIGGTAADLDSIDGAALSQDDFAMVMVGNIIYHYQLNATSGAAESSPNVITPDTNAGTKRWILQSVGAGITLAGALDPNGYSIGMDKGADIASASPLVIGTDGDYFDVTGVTGFAAMTVTANRHFFLQFDAILIMTHHATNLDLPGGANITTAAGDVGEFFSTGANTVQCVNYTKADGKAVIASGIANVVEDTTPQLGGTLDTNTKAINLSYDTVASHATTSAIWAAAGNIINFTGTETITDFPAADRAGSTRTLICAGACIFTHAGSITVQGGATYTASAGDMVLITATTTTAFKVNILRQTETGTGSAVMATSPTLITPLLGTPASGDLQNCSLATAPAIGETAPNSVRGTNKEVYITETGSLTAAQCSGTIVSNYGMTDADCVATLPTAAEGLACVVTLPAIRAKYFRLSTPVAQADKINLLTAGAWVAGADDGYVGVASGYAGNDSISVYCAKVTDGGFEWFAIPLSGTWVAG